MSETDPREQTQNDLPGSFSAAQSGLGLDQLRDSDGDGLSDLHEVAIGTNPNRFDSDGDGVSDRLEAEFTGFRDTQIGQSNPYNDLVDPLSGSPAATAAAAQRGDPGIDTDGDGLTDAAEQRLGTDAHEADTDSDGLQDGLEVLIGSRPDRADTDNDGVSDAQEVRNYTDVNVEDSDHDGRSDAAEAEAGTLGYFADADNDGLGDQHERNIGTDPDKADTDGDREGDQAEVYGGTNPLNRDTDGDGHIDGVDRTPLEFDREREWYEYIDPTAPIQDVVDVVADLGGHHEPKSFDPQAKESSEADRSSLDGIASGDHAGRHTDPPIEPSVIRSLPVDGVVLAGSAAHTIVDDVPELRAPLVGALPDNLDLVSSLDLDSLNPQPVPPVGLVTPDDPEVLLRVGLEGLNPQPVPPVGLVTPDDPEVLRVDLDSLNPQPVPPVVDGPELAVVPSAAAIAELQAPIMAPEIFGASEYIETVVQEPIQVAVVPLPEPDPGPVLEVIVDVAPLNVAPLNVAPLPLPEPEPIIDPVVAGLDLVELGPELQLTPLLETAPALELDLGDLDG